MYERVQQAILIQKKIELIKDPRYSYHIAFKVKTKLRHGDKAVKIYKKYKAVKQIRKQIVKGKRRE